MLLSAAVSYYFYDGDLGIPAKKAREICKAALTEQGWEIKQDFPLHIYAAKPAKKALGGLIEYPGLNAVIDLKGLKTKLKFQIRTDSGQTAVVALGDRIVELANEDADLFDRKSPAEREAALRADFDAYIFIS